MATTPTSAPSRSPEALRGPPRRRRSATAVLREDHTLHAAWPCDGQNFLAPVQVGDSPEQSTEGPVRQDRARVDRSMRDDRPSWPPPRAPPQGLHDLDWII